MSGKRRQDTAAEDGKTLNMRLNDDDRARLKRIIGRMVTVKGGLPKAEAGFGYAGAARYAFRRVLELEEADSR